jgi:DNA-binding NtrC family response regulator
MLGRVMIVDDEKLTRETLALSLADEHFEVVTATNGFEAIARLEEHPVDVVVTDLRMPSMDGLTFQGIVRERWPEIAVVFMTAFGSVTSAVSAMRAGAADYLTKPLNADELVIRVRRLVERRRDRDEITRLRASTRAGLGAAGPVFRSPAMAAVFEQALAVAATDATVLIEGETGCGKDVLARFIHENSHRPTGPYVAVNCAELNPNLIESELFGHEAGAFTGAARARQGRFEAAAGGTLLIDEVDDLPREIQVRLLRFLHDRSFERVGSSKTQRGDVRIVCATKRSLEALVREGQFRADLYYRIHTIHLMLPPLRGRREDILPLTEHFLSRFATQRKSVVPELTPEALECLLAHDWPGNVRELEHAIEHAVMFARSGPLEPGHLPAHLRNSAARPVVELHLEGVEQIDVDDLLRQTERRLFDWALSRTAGNQARAAERLGLSRTTMPSRIAALREIGESTDVASETAD